MKQLPPGWAETTVGDLGVWRGGSTPSKAIAAYWANGTIPWLSPKDMKSSRLNGSRDQVTAEALSAGGLTLLAPGSVAVVVRSGILERTLPVALVTVPATLNQDVKAVTAHKGYVPEWVLYVLKALEEEVLSSCRKRGTTVASIDSGRFLALSVPVPPRNEQARIVAAIEEAFSLIDAGETALHNTRTRLTRMRESVLTAAVTGKLAPQDPTDTPPKSLRIGDPQEAEGLEIQSLPDGWVVASLGSVAEMSLGKMLDARAQTGLHPQPYLRNMNVRWFDFDASSLLTMDVTPSELHRVTVRAGDLVVCEGGEPGRCAVWHGEPIVIQKALHRVRPLLGIRSDFLALVLRWWTRQDGFSRFVTGTTIKHLPKEKLRLLPIPLPPTEEQARIVSEAERQFSFIEAAEQEVAAALVRSAALRRSILQAAFAGELVSQDPSDEPAAVLLERIRAARPSPVKGSRPRGRKVAS